MLKHRKRQRFLSGSGPTFLSCTFCRSLVLTQGQTSEKHPAPKDIWQCEAKWISGFICRLARTRRKLITRAGKYLPSTMESLNCGRKMPLQLDQTRQYSHHAWRASRVTVYNFPSRENTKRNLKKLRKNHIIQKEYMNLSGNESQHMRYYMRN